MQHVLEVLQRRRVDQELVAHARGRQERGEQHDEHQPEPLRGHGVEAQRRRHGQVLHLRAPAPGRDHAGEHTEHDRDQRAERHHRDRVGQIADQVVQDRPGVLVGHAQVEVGELGQVVAVLHQHRLVEAELLGQRDLERRGRVRDPGQVAHDRPGQCAEQDEVECDGDEASHEGLDYSPGQVTRLPHSTPLSPRTARVAATHYSGAFVRAKSSSPQTRWTLVNVTLLSELKAP